MTATGLPLADAGIADVSSARKRRRQDDHAADGTYAIPVPWGANKPVLSLSKGKAHCSSVNAPYETLIFDHCIAKRYTTS